MDEGVTFSGIRAKVWVLGTYSCEMEKEIEIEIENTLLFAMIVFLRRIRG